MCSDRATHDRSLLLLAAGAKGAIGSTIAAATVMMAHDPDRILPGMMSGTLFPGLGQARAIKVAGWDQAPDPLGEVLNRQGILPEHLWRPHLSDLDSLPILPAPDASDSPVRQVEQLVDQIGRLRSQDPGARAVMVNLLPASKSIECPEAASLAELLGSAALGEFPDLIYTIAAVRCGVPVVNFTPNCIELPAVVAAARERSIPLIGRDGKTGQTYLKVVLASALKARHLEVDGWYSLNILGNADGANLMDPDRAAGKLANKTDLLTDILGYSPGEHYGSPTHRVHIDYYPPRGDAKEAWDVIDFKGIFGLPMSLRVNLVGRDSILAAPMVLDLARWAAALKLSGRGGLVPELAFFFKKPLGDSPPLTFQDQLRAMDLLAENCRLAGAANGRQHPGRKWPGAR
jgi:myo-inositol-1-phosphate synthase